MEPEEDKYKCGYEHLPAEIDTLEMKRYINFSQDFSDNALNFKMNEIKGRSAPWKA